MTLLVKKILGGVAAVLILAAISYGIVSRIERGAVVEERIRVIEAEQTIRDSVIRAVRESPREVEEALDYLESR